VSRGEVERVKSIIIIACISSFKVLIRAAASLKQPIGSKLAMECAQKIFVLPEENVDWNPQLTNMLRVVWQDKGIQETFDRQGKEYILDDPETVLYIFSNLERIIEPDFVPNLEDLNMTKKWEQTINEPFSDQDYVSVIRDFIFSEVKNLLVTAAKTKISFGSHETLTLAKKMLSIKDDTLEWNIEMKQLIEGLMTDEGITKIYQKKNDNYFLNNYIRMIELDFIPTEEDIKQLSIYIEGVPENKVKKEKNQNNTEKTVSDDTPKNNLQESNNNRSTEVDDKIERNKSISISVSNKGTQTNENKETPLTITKSNSTNTNLIKSITKQNNSEPFVLLLITIPSLSSTKLIKAFFSETPVAVINRIRKKPGVNLDPDVNYVCWIVKKGHEPEVMDNDQLINNFNLKQTNETIMLLKEGENCSDFQVESFHDEKKNIKGSKKMKKSVSKKENKEFKDKDKDKDKKKN